MKENQYYDVIVVGAGNAALCAALSASDNGASVLVIEKAPEYLRGGNTYFSGGLFRFSYKGLADILDLIPDISSEEAEKIDVGFYDKDAFRSDLMRVTNDQSDPLLADILVSNSFQFKFISI